jgi:Fe-S-cluster-containing dehydrogenase component
MKPACVTRVPWEARVFGDLNDPESEVSKILAKERCRSSSRSWGRTPR